MSEILDLIKFLACCGTIVFVAAKTVTGRIKHISFDFGFLSGLKFECSFFEPEDHA